MAQSSSVFDTIASHLAPVHREGHKFVAGGAAITLLLFLLWTPLGWIAAALTAYVAYFFRDPDRVTPLREGLVISPADGEIVAIDRVVPLGDLELGDEPVARISIFLSLFDVHINRAPVSGRVLRSVYSPGVFLNAALDKASEENERRSLVFENHKGQRIGVVQIAGLIARRIVTFVSEEATIGVGERFGLIRFGSRVDVYLPAGKSPLVAVGQRSVGGETVLADLNSDEGEREARIS
jgi:phosphatidylserine decarboxylase